MNKNEIDYTVCRKIFTDFGGYEKEVFEAISVTYLGLGIVGVNSSSGSGSGSGSDNTVNGDGNSNSASSSSSNNNNNSTNDFIYQSTGRTPFHSSLTAQLFSPPKGLLIHGPSGML